MTRPPDESDPTPSVSDEAMRLMEALAGLTAAHRPPQSEPGAASSGRAERDAARASEDSAEPACACSTPVVESVCGVCPICRGVALLHSIQPETMERVADLLGMVAGSLQAVAADRRESRAGAEAPAEPEGPARERGRQETVDVVDADADEQPGPDDV
ncbi:hypothetical protein PZ938_14185 [Luteipulveratus sp. YIM 133132]|uniref:hypothetical protein n=1 Tax=Luteipulveratus flavus TaxID=3031728 RepID=UPI0023AF41B4|nr:hypothetical protein [Luteipulveratus sp. YIM 133132]MDE9366759.1 hypothetical protein [Luteipulveratus sp. YIM 133132]